MNTHTNTIYIEIVDNHEKSLQGYIKKAGIKPLAFTDLKEMLLLFDKVCEISEQPQASMKIRSFIQASPDIDVKALESDEELTFEKDSIVLAVVLSFRQNASWQGFVNIDEAVVHFRSELEFIKIIDQYIVKDEG